MNFAKKITIVLTIITCEVMMISIIQTSDLQNLRMFIIRKDLGESNTMSDLTVNKISAGVLCGALLIMGSIKAGEFLLPHQELAENAYPIEVPEGAVAASAAPAAPVQAAPILALLASADLAKGEKLAKKCTACHGFDEGGAAKVGPNLYNLINASKGRDGGYSYSAALAGLGGEWTYTELNGFLHKPKKWLEGTKMNFAGLKKPEDRANLIGWMRSLSSSPAALPTAEEIAAEGNS